MAPNAVSTDVSTLKRRREDTAGGSIPTATFYSDGTLPSTTFASGNASSAPKVVSTDQAFTMTLVAGKHAIPSPHMVSSFAEIHLKSLNDYKGAQSSLQRATATSNGFALSSSGGTPTVVTNHLHQEKTSFPNLGVIWFWTLDYGKVMVYWNDGLECKRCTYTIGRECKNFLKVAGNHVVLVGVCIWKNRQHSSTTLLPFPSCRPHVAPPLSTSFGCVVAEGPTYDLRIRKIFCVAGHWCWTAVVDRHRGTPDTIADRYLNRLPSDWEWYWWDVATSTGMQLSVVSACMLTPFVPPDAVARISLRDRIYEPVLTRATGSSPGAVFRCPPVVAAIRPARPRGIPPKRYAPPERTKKCKRRVALCLPCELLPTSHPSLLLEVLAISNMLRDSLDRVPILEQCGRNSQIIPAKPHQVKKVFPDVKLPSYQLVKSAPGVDEDPRVTMALRAANESLAAAHVAATALLSTVYSVQVEHCRQLTNAGACADRFAADLTAYCQNVVHMSGFEDVDRYEIAIAMLKRRRKPSPSPTLARTLR
ncbi:hypothetical protein B0H14DRAFT_2556615 [Mycena olivaceomarginata]|nr:hypothetical protein B0H14DRAFT_2556615 [Mycena olivaceomarginata]